MKRAGTVLLFLLALVLAGILIWFVWVLLQLPATPVAKDSEPASNVKEVVPEPVTPPLSFEGFNPGRIIGDEEFYDSGAMNLQQVEDFIAEVNYGCREGWENTPCLAEYAEDAPTFPADDYCYAFEGESEESAASILYRAAQSCGINPKVLLVMLQKEQGLLTASGFRLDETRYTIAMGYGCPDTENCDPTFFGFGQQTYYAARQLRRYATEPGEYSILPEQKNKIRYNANSKCGKGKVFVENYATAGLYNYTPYQPNKAALAGDPDSCSSVGNLYFYAYYDAWFGIED